MTQAAQRPSEAQPSSMIFFVAQSWVAQTGVARVRRPAEELMGAAVEPVGAGPALLHATRARKATVPRIVFIGGGD